VAKDQGAVVEGKGEVVGEVVAEDAEGAAGVARDDGQLEDLARGRRGIGIGFWIGIRIWLGIGDDRGGRVAGLGAGGWGDGEKEGEAHPRLTASGESHVRSQWGSCALRAGPCA
jgi:hypothetical protein